MLHAIGALLCLTLHGDVDRERCPAAAVASLEAGFVEGVSPRLLLAIGWRESGWRHRCRSNGANGAWQVIGPRCEAVAKLGPAARAGARTLAWWQRRARAHRLPARRALAAYACGYRGLRGRCDWYARDVARILGER